MLPRERVISVIQHGRPDRVPIYGWVRENLAGPISEMFGSVEAFEDRYEFDLAHLFGGPRPYSDRTIESLRNGCAGEVTPAALLAALMGDVDERSAYDDVVRQIEHYKHARGRFVYMQTPGIFEALNDVFGIENHLCHLIEYEEDLHRVYARQAQWNRRFAMNCLDLGVDMVHVSDDWGAQRGLLFSPQTWRRLICPYHKITCDAVKRRGAFLSLHSDGNINAVIDSIVELGFDVVHPWQESAGMSLADFRANYRDRFVVMGGLDIQTTLGFGRLDHLRREIERILRLFADGGLIFCTTHFVQEHCTMEELVFAFDAAYELSRAF